MTYTLTRFSQSDEGTFGTLEDESGKQLCITAEPPPEGEHPCIPEGTYYFQPHNGEHWKHVWEATNVPGRSNILIHAGNVPVPYTDDNGVDHWETKGCIMVGKSIGWIGTHQAVTESVSALNYLRTVLPDNFTMTIKGVHP